ELDDRDRRTRPRRLDHLTCPDEDRDMVDRAGAAGPGEEQEVAGPQIPPRHRLAMDRLAIGVARERDPEPAKHAVCEPRAVEAVPGRTAPEIGQSEEASGDPD